MNSDSVKYEVTNDRSAGTDCGNTRSHYDGNMDQLGSQKNQRVEDAIASNITFIMLY